jgi:hypothetical protein
MAKVSFTSLNTALAQVARLVLAFFFVPLGTWDRTCVVMCQALSCVCVTSVRACVMCLDVCMRAAALKANFNRTDLGCDARFASYQLFNVRLVASLSVFDELQARSLRVLHTTYFDAIVALPHARQVLYSTSTHVTLGHMKRVGPPTPPPSEAGPFTNFASTSPPDSSAAAGGSGSPSPTPPALSPSPYAPVLVDAAAAKAFFSTTKLVIEWFEPEPQSSASRSSASKPNASAAAGAVPGSTPHRPSSSSSSSSGGVNSERMRWRYLCVKWPPNQWTVTIGRDRSNTICIADPSISRTSLCAAGRFC